MAPDGVGTKGIHDAGIHRRRPGELAIHTPDWQMRVQVDADKVFVVVGGCGRAEEDEGADAERHEAEKNEGGDDADGGTGEHAGTGGVSRAQRADPGRAFRSTSTRSRIDQWWQPMNPALLTR